MSKVGHPYTVGTQVQDKQGRVKVKVSSGDDGSKWMSRGRYNYMKHYKIDLSEFHRVFHIDGDIANDDPKNLTAIKFSGKRYSFERSRVIFEPKGASKARPFISKFIKTAA